MDAAIVILAVFLAGLLFFYLQSSGDSSGAAETASPAPAKSKKKKKSKAQKKAAAAASAAAKASESASAPAEAATKSGSKKKKKPKNAQAPQVIRDAAPVEQKVEQKVEKKAETVRRRKKKNVLDIVAKEDPDWGDDSGWNTVKSDHIPKAKPKAASRSVIQQVIRPEGKQSDEPSESIRVERQYHSFIIGLKFATLNSIQDATQTRITMPGRESVSTLVQIAGAADGIKKAKKCIKDLVEKGYSHLLSPNLTDSHIFVPIQKRGIISGKQGANVKLLESTFDVRIRLPNRDSEATRVYIVGAKDNVKKARNNIKLLLQYNYSPVTHPGWVKDEMDFPQHLVGILIGPRGSKIKSIKADSKCDISVPDYINEQKLIIVGPRAGIDRAKMLINRIVNPPEEQLERQRQRHQKKDEYYPEEEEDEDTSWALPPSSVTQMDW